MISPSCLPHLIKHVSCHILYTAIILLIVSTACSVPQAKFTPPPLNKPTLTTYTGPRFRVAVSPFQSSTKVQSFLQHLNFQNMHQGLTELATNLLVEAGYLSVLERSLLSGVSANHQVEADASLFDQSSTQKKGGFLGAEYMLVGFVDEIEPNVSQSEQGIKIPHLMDLKTSTQHASVRLGIRLVHARTSEVVAAGVGHGVIKTFGMSFKVNRLPIGNLNANIGVQQTTRTPLGFAFHAALYQAIDALAQKLKKAPWSCRVASVKPPRVFVDCGEQHHLKAGMRFLYYTRKGEIKNEQDKVIGYDDHPNGEVILQSIQPKMSIGIHKGKTTPKAGDVVVFEQKSLNKKDNKK